MLAKPWKDRTFAYPRSGGYPDGFIWEPAGVSKKSLEAKSDGRIQKKSCWFSQELDGSSRHWVERLLL